jgi:protein phosphatase
MSVIRSFGETNAGRKRRRNEDAFVCEPPIFAVADGMGGAQAGEVASSLAATALSGALAEQSQIPAQDAEATVRNLILEANRRVHQRAVSDVAASGMGTTMTVALAGSGDMIAIGHVGDSRAYLLRDAALEQVTDDHSLVAELVRRGELSAAEAEVHPQRSVITRALGTDPDVDVDVFSIQAQSGDVFLLCSDGLSTMLDTDTIAEILQRRAGDVEGAAHDLIRGANDAGGDDNITVVLFEVGDGGEGAVVAASSAAAVVDTSDEEDTLHPEDGVPVIVVADEAEAPAEETVVAPVAEREEDAFEAAGAGVAGAGVAGAEPVSDQALGGSADGATLILTAEAVHTAMETAVPERERFPFVRLFFATLLIVVLTGLIVLLAVWGLAR